MVYHLLEIGCYREEPLRVPHYGPRLRIHRAIAPLLLAVKLLHAFHVLLNKMIAVAKAHYVLRVSLV